MAHHRIAELIAGGETDLLELKREWWDLASNLGKGRMARDILAMANAVTQSESGLIVIGVDDPKAGGAIIGVSLGPSQEAVAQILDTYTNPVPRIRLDEVTLGGKRLSLIEVVWTESHPYYATRDVDTILSTDAVYTRRAGTVGRLKPVEIERLIRAKDARLGRMTDRTPLQVGFVELPIPGFGNRIAVRVVNVTEEPVTNINASVDISLLHFQRAVYRRPLIANLTLGPGQSQEFECRPSDGSFYDEHAQPLDYLGRIWSGWLDLRLHLTYRGRDGLLSSIVRDASVG